MTDPLLIKEIEGVEGVRFTVYNDRAGNPTIGVGHKLTADELHTDLLYTGAPWRDSEGNPVPLTQAEVDDLLAHDLRAAEDDVTTLVSVPLNAHQYDALVSFRFNIGGGAFKGSTLLKLLNGPPANYESVAEQMPRWVYDAGSVDPVLVKRRQTEIALWNSPVDDGTANQESA